MSIGLVGKKSGMSRLFQEDGTSIPVTVISVAANFIADIKTHEKHGYSAVVVSKNTSKNLTKSSSEFFKKQNIPNGFSKKISYANPYVWDVRIRSICGSKTFENA